MSIREEILAKEADGGLTLLQPMIDGAPHPRLLYASTQLMAVVKDNLADAGKVYRMGRLRADFDHFSTGGLITVSRGREKHAYLKQLDPPSDEVWEIRSRDPKPSLRVFGRLAEANVFICTHLCERINLAEPTSAQWKIEIRRCKSEWRKLFPTYQPVSSEQLNDYITDDVVDLGFYE